MHYFTWNKFCHFADIPLGLSDGASGGFLCGLPPDLFCGDFLAFAAVTGSLVVTFCLCARIGSVMTSSMQLTRSFDSEKQ